MNVFIVKPVGKHSKLDFANPENRHHVPPITAEVATLPPAPADLSRWEAAIRDGAHGLPLSRDNGTTGEGPGRGLPRLAAQTADWRAAGRNLIAERGFCPSVRQPSLAGSHWGQRGQCRGEWPCIFLWFLAFPFFGRAPSTCKPAKLINAICVIFFLWSRVPVIWLCVIHHPSTARPYMNQVWNRIFIFQAEMKYQSIHTLSACEFCNVLNYNILTPWCWKQIGILYP